MNMRFAVSVVVVLAMALAIGWFIRRSGDPLGGNTIESSVAAAAREYIDTAKPAVFLIQGDPGVVANRPRSQLGGVPVRVGGEAWPVSGETGSPMILLAQIARDGANAAYMGDVELLRVFADIRLILDEIDGSDAFELRITPVGSIVDFGDWPDEVLADVAAAGRQIDYDPLTAPYFLAAQRARVGDDEILQNAYHSSPEHRFDTWWAALDAAVTKLQVNEPTVDSPRNRTSLGGFPYWVQRPETHKYPFFLQLGPEGPLRFGDGAHIYIFLDRSKPLAGWQVLVQMG